VFTTTRVVAEIVSQASVRIGGREYRSDDRSSIAFLSAPRKAMPRRPADLRSAVSDPPRGVSAGRTRRHAGTRARLRSRRPPEFESSIERVCREDPALERHVAITNMARREEDAEHSPDRAGVGNETARRALMCASALMFACRRRPRPHYLSPGGPLERPGPVCLPPGDVGW